MAETPSNSNEDETTNRIYVIVGTCHPIQWRPKDLTPPERELIDGLDSLIRALVSKYKIRLIAEETLGPNSPPTVAHQIAKDEKIRYLEIDMLPHEAEKAGILEEMGRRYDPSSGENPNAEVRLCRADDTRENFWLDKIEGTKVTPVLVVCGWAHSGFLAKKVRARHCVVTEDIYFPPCLREGKIERVAAVRPIARGC